MVEEELNNYMFNFIKEVCEDVGPRESGTEEEIQAGNMIEREMKEFCDDTYQETYMSNPRAFLGGIRYGSILILISIILYWLSVLIDINILLLDPVFSFLFIGLAVILQFITVSYFILEVMRYHEVFDFLFPRRESKNIIGVKKPTEDTKRILIFSAHHDSAYEFNLFYYLKRFGQITIFIGYFGTALLFIVSTLKFGLQLFSINIPVVFFSFGIFFALLTPIVILYIFFHSYNSVLGAFDNLSGVAIVLGIGKKLDENKQNGKFFPKNTEVRLISFAGEEAGLRGAKRYLRKHKNELKEQNVQMINMDSIAEKGGVIILNKEILIGAKHDPEIYKKLLQIAEDLNINGKIRSLPFGATDAAAFSRKGIPATTISGLNLEQELAPYYHTREDTPDVIDKEALGPVVDICLEYIKHIDSRS